MAGKRIHIQQLVLEGVGVKPTIPSPSNILPDDSRWKETDILKAELCYNKTDKVWYYRNYEDEIKTFSVGEGGSMTAAEIRDSLNFLPEGQKLPQSAIEGLVQSFEQLNTALNSKVNTETGKSLILDTEIAKLAEITGTNTGDETASTILNKIGDGSTISPSYLPAVTLSYASQAEAESNTENTKVMTALRVFQNWLSNVTSYSISALNTTSKFIVGAINELKAGKQDGLVSGTNIKTLNGESILGSGNIEISASGAELTSNKVSSFQAVPDDTHYPSEKLVKDNLDNHQTQLNALAGNNQVTFSAIYAYNNFI